MTNSFVIGAVAATQVLPNTIWRSDGSGARLDSPPKHTGMTDFDILLGSKLPILFSYPSDSFEGTQDKLREKAFSTSKWFDGVTMFLIWVELFMLHTTIVQNLRSLRKYGVGNCSRQGAKSRSLEGKDENFYE